MLRLKRSKHLKLISLAKIQEATQNFALVNCIGRGGYGMVYKGYLSIAPPDSQTPILVAIKRLNEKFGQGSKEFLTEIELLSGQKHPNLIHLLGYCVEQNEKIIVYEYVKCGSLDWYLSSSDTLTWLERLKICVGAARGLEYLHYHVGKHQSIIHRDIKSANILIDENLVAKVSDLGLSKLTLAGLDRTQVVTHACGTHGYCEPEYIITGIVTKESDVYSFGILLFEVLCGRLDTRDYYLNNSLDEIVDPSLREDMNLNSRNRFAAIAKRCLLDDRGERPPMHHVVKELEELFNLQVSSIHYSLYENNGILKKCMKQYVYSIKVKLCW
ncbi:putative protein kinase RLK-Pelle-CrRLK1L-1 family [Helianthus annuus]|nr:putative protein kinase RLK-Pelle-CrRLK1L-1 family [Helianthus annuus]